MKSSSNEDEGHQRLDRDKIGPQRRSGDRIGWLHPYGAGACEIQEGDEFGNSKSQLQRQERKHSIPQRHHHSQAFSCACQLKQAVCQVTAAYIRTRSLNKGQCQAIIGLVLGEGEFFFSKSMSAFGDCLGGSFLLALSLLLAIGFPAIRRGSFFW